MKIDIQKHLGTGEKLDLFVDHDGTMLELSSCVEAVIDHDRIMIQAPFLQREYYPLKRDEKIRLVARLESAGVLEMIGTIVQNTHFGPTTVLIVELDPDIQQTQRRNYFRLPVSRDVQFVDRRQNFKHEPIDGITQDLSAGGLRCISAHEMKPGTRIQVHLNLTGDPIVLEGEILEAQPFEPTPNRFMARIRFLEPSEKARSRIISFIFTEQSKRKKLNFN